MTQKPHVMLIGEDGSECVCIFEVERMLVLSHEVSVVLCSGQFGSEWVSEIQKSQLFDDPAATQERSFKRACVSKIAVGEDERKSVSYAYETVVDNLGISWISKT